MAVLQALWDLICGNLSIQNSCISITFISAIFLWHASHWSTQRATILNQELPVSAKYVAQPSLVPPTVINWELGATVTTMATRLSNVKQRKLTWSPCISHLNYPYSNCLTTNQLWCSLCGFAELASLCAEPLPAECRSAIDLCTGNWLLTVAQSIYTPHNNDKTS